jgi:uncharacterized protein (DUF488 family)
MAMVGNPEDDTHLHWRGMHFSFEKGQLVIHDTEKVLNLLIEGQFSREEVAFRLDNLGVTVMVRRFPRSE